MTASACMLVAAGLVVIALLAGGGALAGWGLGARPSRIAALVLLTTVALAGAAALLVKAGAS